MKRTKPKDDRGHKPRPLLTVKFDECIVCHDVRVRDGTFRRVCPGEKHAERYMGE
jgi:DNA-binding cell septation regulator SpoVG